MKYLGWFIGILPAPAWVSVTLAVGWTLLATMQWKKFGYGFNFVLYCVLGAVRFGIAIGGSK